MRTLVRLSKSCGFGLLASSLVTYVFGEVWWRIYVWKTGVGSASELAEDYGGAFFQLIAMLFVFVVVFALSSIFMWHKSKPHLNFAEGDAKTSP
ncbi:hypothetical protein [Uliginosibacterium sp. 31-12]|uniref:hypothetical protein n=1 Tax=Uliginosibacterium sp. 31-12 TaxID=3062781 RepID=UPI0026E48019|nr:hypothetical protein [Uliginosibacterium sp. 31-12]MDO6388460.1 hypothetical protein [Uliginosibacterium sp. 31-12]